jgi:hypothetical protein
MNNYEITAAGKAIRCLICGAISYHPKDIEERYCGRCHIFHDEKIVLLSGNRPEPSAGCACLHKPLLSDVFCLRLPDGQYVDRLLWTHCPGLWAVVREALNE